jgi:hypothetical protein
MPRVRTKARGKWQFVIVVLRKTLAIFLGFHEATAALESRCNSVDTIGAGA